jgi:hypothetical protein
MLFANAPFHFAFHIILNTTPRLEINFLLLINLSKIVLCAENNVLQAFAA